MLSDVEEGNNLMSRKLTPGGNTGTKHFTTMVSE